MVECTGTDKILFNGCQYFKTPVYFFEQLVIIAFPCLFFCFAKMVISLQEIACLHLNVPPSILWASPPTGSLPADDDKLRILWHKFRLSCHLPS